MQLNKHNAGVVIMALGILGLIAALLYVATSAVSAHDSAAWIQEQSLSNRVGEWCCGPQDCNAVEPKDFTATPDGYLVPATGELIPYSEPQPFSPDGKLWICRRPDHSRRCVFDKPPGS